MAVQDRHGGLAEELATRRALQPARRHFVDAVVIAGRTDRLALGVRPAHLPDEETDLSFGHGGDVLDAEVDGLRGEKEVLHSRYPPLPIPPRLYLLCSRLTSPVSGWATTTSRWGEKRAGGSGYPALVTKRASRNLE